MLDVIAQVGSPGEQVFVVMYWSFVACVILPPLLVYLGLHVVRRGIIFIDIAMAQMASLGFCVGALWGLELEDSRNVAIALSFTVAAAALFSFTNKSESEVPHEAVIGIAYVVAAAAAVLVLSRAAHGDEEIKNMLVGNILLVSPGDLLSYGSFFGKFLPDIGPLIRWLSPHDVESVNLAQTGFMPGTAWVFAFVALIHFVFRRQLLGVSFTRDEAIAKRVKVRAWDFVFYALFGLMVTSFVRIAGVLLVFSYLIVPAVCAVVFARTIAMRMLVGCIVALLGGIGGLIWSFKNDLPTGAAIVCALGILLIAAASVAPLIRKKNRARDAAG